MVRQNVTDGLLENGGVLGRVVNGVATVVAMVLGVSTSGRMTLQT